MSCELRLDKHVRDNRWLWQPWNNLRPISAVPWIFGDVRSLLLLLLAFVLQHQTYLWHGTTHRLTLSLLLMQSSIDLIFLLFCIFIFNLCSYFFFVKGWPNHVIYLFLWHLVDFYFYFIILLLMSFNAFLLYSQDFIATHNILKGKGDAHSVFS